MPAYEYDVFISHAVEDKQDFVNEFAADLLSRGVKVWYSTYEIKMGDSIMDKIKIGLKQSAFGIVVLSPTYFQKPYAREEMKVMFSQEHVDRRKRILPIWHKVDHKDVLEHESLLADRLGIKTDKGIPAVSEQVIDVINTYREEAQEKMLTGAVVQPMPQVQQSPAYADLKYMLARGKTEDVIDQLMQLTSTNMRTNNQVVMQSGRYHSLQNQIAMGTMTQEYQLMQQNQIRQALLYIINNLDN